MKDLKMYINGQFCESSNGQWIDVLNPSTEEVISRQPEGTIEDVNRALDAARAAQKANEEIVVELFRKLHEEGTTLVVVTHNPEVAEVAQRTVVLRNGKVDHEKINENFTGKIKHITLQ